jgi:tetratricopeptide (TPR) repeat protein
MSDTPRNEPVNDQDQLADSPDLRYNLDSLDDYISVSETVAREGRYDEAVDVLREANRRYPESPTGRYNLGVALFLRVKQDREHLELWENLADDEQYAEEAMAALEGAVDADPQFYQAYNNLGRLYALRGRKNDAITAWEKSLAIKPDQADVEADMRMYRDKIAPTDEDIEAQEINDSTRPDKDH